MKQICLCVLTTVMLLAQAPNHTFGMLNGRGWRGASEAFRAGYLQGYGDAFTLPADRWFKGTFTVGEVQDALDNFYKEPANSAVELPRALMAVAMKFNGETAATVEEYVRTARAIAALDNKAGK
jgi:hypothetical protein